MEKWAIYLRKSRADRDAEKYGITDTLERHRTILTELAAREGFYVEKLYEEVVSGDTIQARPEVQQLIADCYAGKYKGILVMAVDRLSRGNQGDAQQILDCLKYSNRNNGVLVVTPSRRYDIAHSSDDEDFMEMELFFARKEYKTIKKRMDTGKKQTIIEGNYMGSYRPYGYQIFKKGKLRTLKEDLNEGPIVRKMFDWRINQNMSSGAIARKLTDLGVPTYRNAKEWSKDTVKSILMNPTYCGKVRWNDRMRVKIMKDGQLVNSRPRSNHTAHYMEYDGWHEGLISTETFQAAQEGFYSDRAKANVKLQNPLAGLLICKKCGYTMRHQRYTTKQNVEPRYIHKQSKICNEKSVVEKDVMDAFIHGLKLCLEDYETTISNEPDVDVEEIQMQIDKLQKERKNIERILDSIFTDYENGIYTANEFVQRKQKHNARLEVIEKQIHELEIAVPKMEQYEEKTISLHNAIDMLKDDDIDAKTKNEYLKTFIEKIEYSRESTGEFMLDIYLK